MGSQSLELSPNSTYFLETSHDTFSHNDIKTLVCGQCHNQLAMYRGVYAKPGNTFDSINPYRYGTDADALYQAAIEDGAAVMPEEATGAQLVMSSGENELEVFEGSNHQAQGLTCVDCHMTTATNSEGEEYINHNSSGSPLENEVALQKCLTCHNYDTTEEMVDMVRAKQEETADTQARLEGKVATLKELLTEATASGTADETILKEARENYSRANFYVQYYPGWLTKEVHNPDAFESYLSRAEYLLDESIAQLS